MDVAQLVEPLPRKYKDRDLIPSPGKLGVVQLTRPQSLPSRVQLKSQKFKVILNFIERSGPSWA